MARQPFVETVTRDASASGGVPSRSPLASLLVSLRPGQWTKNLVVFAGLLFGRRLFEPGAVAVAVAAFAIFCVLSGVIYLLNDVADREADRRHPLKSKRPIASGQLSPGAALAAAGVVGPRHLTRAGVEVLRPGGSEERGSAGDRPLTLPRLHVRQQALTEVGELDVEP